MQEFKTAELFKPIPNTLQYGISPLHAWIRFFECIVHISYRYDLCKWQIRGTSKKKILLCRKKEIQQRFFKNLHLHEDKPKLGGFGSTNDCNSTRRAFENVKKFSDITNVDEELIKKFKTILMCISSQYQINLDKFEKYCFDTAKHYMSKYPWYLMPATVHIVLMQTVENTVLPIGYFGEGGPEARHKVFKQDRQF